MIESIALLLLAALYLATGALTVICAVFDPYGGKP